MSDQNPFYERLAEHIGHAVVVVQYGDGENVAVECEDCRTVLVDADRAEPATKRRRAHGHRHHRDAVYFLAPTRAGGWRVVRVLEHGPYHDRRPATWHGPYPSELDAWQSNPQKAKE